MQDFLPKNLKIIEERFPELIDLIVSSELPLSRRFFPGPTGHMVYQIQDNDHWKYLTSTFAPETEAERQVSELVKTAVKMIFVLGEAGFYHIEALLDGLKGKTETKVILFSVQPRVIRQVLQSRDLQKMLADERFFIVLRPESTKFRADIQEIFMADVYTIPTFEFLIHPVEERYQSEFFIEFHKYLNWAGMTALVTHNTTQVFEHWWIHNFTCNIPYILRGVPFSELKDSWSGKPVIVIGAGPSLNKNIEVLRRSKGKALLFCVDTAYRILVQHDIEPDLLVTLDGSSLNAEHLKEQNYQDIPLFLDLYSHRDIVHNHGHNTSKILLTGRNYHSGWWEKITDKLEDVRTMETGGSVATVAFALARYIGADPLILVGVDLSYPGGSCYALGALHGNKTVAEVRSNRQMFEVRDIYGNVVETTYDYRYYLKWLEMQASLKDRQYINATEGGALCEGFKITTLTETIESQCVESQPVADWLKALQPHPVPEELWNKVFYNVKRTRREMKAAGSYLKNMAITMEKYLAELENKKYEEIEKLTLGLERLKEYFNRLEFAKLYLDAHSFGAVYTDITLTDSISQNEDQHPETERAMLAARQSYNLLLSLKQLSTDSLQMLDDGLASMIQASSREGENK